MSLLSTHPTSTSDLHINLHPLILLTISDYITRHTLRAVKTPIVGALLGQQNGRTISLEHAFECELVPHPEFSPDGGSSGHGSGYLLHDTWFRDRLQQYKDVHQAPALELVGWFTTAPVTGPENVHLPIHQQFLHTFNETAILLAFHPTNVLEGPGVGGKLPLTIYESVYESAAGDGTSMEVDGQEKDAPLEMRFKELPYGVETGEAEMIGVDCVARGGGNATAVDGTVKKESKGQASQTVVGKINGKGAAPEKEEEAVDDSALLSAEDEERTWLIYLQAPLNFHVDNFILY